MKAKRAWIVLDSEENASIFFSEHLYLIGVYKIVPIVYFEIDED